MKTLTPRENLVRFFSNQPYEWRPTNADFQRFNPALICGNIARGMVMQQKPYTGEYGGPDLFGVEWYFDPKAGGSMEKAPLLDDIEEWKEKMIFTDLDSLDWEGCAAENSELLSTDKMINATIFTGYFERLISLVGFEEAAIALYDEDTREIVHELFDKLTDYYIDFGKRFKKYFGMGYIEIHDDWGNQRAPMFSPELHREMIVPYIKRFVEGMHEEGIIVEMHSCGSIAPLIPNLISTGIDTWCGQPLNDKKALVEQYGDQFIFCVEVRNDNNPTDDELREMAYDFKKNYEGKKVHIRYGRRFKPEQLRILKSIIEPENE